MSHRVNYKINNKNGFWWINWYRNEKMLVTECMNWLNELVVFIEGKVSNELIHKIFQWTVE